jgi:glycosyltransferase involved in cell wall biosynthesis
MTVAQGSEGRTAADRARPAPRVSVVVPCLDEAASVADCVSRALAALSAHRLDGEVLVVDNGSTDGSAELAAAAGARIVDEPRRGYGSALLAGFAAATGDYIVMADADGTYDFGDVGRFVECLDKGADVVIGDRMDNIERGAMPWAHRRIGNPALSRLLNRLFHTAVRDAHCGIRALRASSLPLLELQATGMELASEMVIRAAKAGLVVTEIPVTYGPRLGRSKLSPFRDGWRHLRLLLVHAPLYLFVLPGAFLTAIGVLAMAAVLGDVELLGRHWYLHTMVGGSLLTVAGAQVLSLGICAHTYGSYYMGERNPFLDRMRARFRLEHGLRAGGVLVLAGLALGGIVVVAWSRRGFASLSEERLAVLASTLVLLGLETVFTSFLLSILGLRRPR